LLCMLLTAEVPFFAVGSGHYSMSLQINDSGFCHQSFHCIHTSVLCFFNYCASNAELMSEVSSFKLPTQRIC